MDTLFRNACRIHTRFAVLRYLASNADGRWDGAEKALRHRELCLFYVAMQLGAADPEELDAQASAHAYKAVHESTRALTDNLDEQIGFPLRGEPDYEALADRFFDRFHALALNALALD